jgi:hypothetical protein
MVHLVLLAKVVLLVQMEHLGRLVLLEHLELMELLEKVLFGKAISNLVIFIREMM